MDNRQWTIVDYGTTRQNKKVFVKIIFKLPGNINRQGTWATGSLIIKIQGNLLSITLGKIQGRVFFRLIHRALVKLDGKLLGSILGKLLGQV
jgi:hypothetical protein